MDPQHTLVYSGAGPSSFTSSSGSGSRYSYEVIPGFFVHDAPLPEDTALPPRFGLVDESPERWTTFVGRIGELQAQAEGEGAGVKVFWLGRHGEGYHNVGEAKYGTKAWDDYYSKLNGDGEITWGPDPELTPLGESQARAAHDLWQTEVTAGMPLPDSLYCSPLTRALRTNQITFDGVVDRSERRTTVVEYCREENGEHTCDRRRTRSYIRATFPSFEIEDGMTEEDELWDPVVRETKAQVDARARAVIGRVFGKDGAETYVSITAHGGWINAFLRVVGHAPVRLPTGGACMLLRCSYIC
ncbi:phosphoglycerate mutase [Punctularia strigosozonata HHB-11173 SS5]|uniref:phosphoglycerate mutase n=1 Tax=Punctularia strigosozonata (strain HHB-11173) TaxID=741275 RepID=UPI0004417BC1|nr:phosphoglycerate mutase [Punctularia strigosozonata HHB-11173 SS5]EIN12161.1 phosphoglycerate mutase [Punctularia strigosozonata HHB-11173 SS5]